MVAQNAPVTPPAVKTKGPKTDAKAAGKTTGDATGEKKDRKPRKDYGYSKESVIELLTQPEDKKAYHGQRIDWFEAVKKFNGKTCGDFVEARKAIKSPKGVVQNPASWLRFFVEDGAIKLNRPAVVAEPAAKAK